MKSNSTIKLWKIRNVRSLKHVPHLSIKVGVSLTHGVSLRLILLLAFQTSWATFQVKNNIRSAPASSALTRVLYRSHNARTPNRHQRGSG